MASAAGAGLGATIVIVLGVATAPFALPAAAFAGALGGVGLAYLMASTRAAGRTSTSLLLGGVAVASFLTALQTYVQQRNTDDLRAVYAFILGRLGTGGWHEVRLALPWVVLACVVLLASRRLLEVLSLGDLEAASLGAHVDTGPRDRGDRGIARDGRRGRRRRADRLRRASSCPTRSGWRRVRATAS